MPGLTNVKRILILRYGLLLLLVAAVYAPTINNGFVWDDTSIIVNNPLIERLGNLPRFFLSEDTAMGFTGYYRPVTYLSFAMDRALWGLNPAGFHLTNLLLHLLVVVLFHALIGALFKNEHLAFVAALIFALHPIAGETVNFLAGGRNTLLCASFALLSLLCYIKNKPIPAAASFTVAIFSKEFALLLPMVFLLHDYRLQGAGIRFRRYLPFLVSIVCYLTLRSVAVHKANFLSTINLADAVKAPYLAVRYAVNMIYTFRLKVLYDVQPDMVVNMLCLAVLGILVGFVFLFRKDDLVVFSSFWFFLFLLPIVNIIPLESASLVADRYAYFSLMGFALLLASATCKMNGRSLTVAVVALCAVYSFIDLRRNSIWENEISFFTRMTEDAPAKFDGYQNLGMYYYKKGDSARAVPYLAIALSKPNIPAGFLIGSASVFWKENMLDNAEQSLLKELELDPRNPEPYLMLITMYEKNSKNTLAASYREMAESLFHGIDKRMAVRAVELCREGEAYISKRLLIPAENVFWQSLLINPDYVRALIGMGSVSANRGDFAKAGFYFNRALEVDPLNVSAHYNLSKIFEVQGRVVDAENEMKKFSEADAIAKQKRRGNAP